MAEHVANGPSELEQRYLCALAIAGIANRTMLATLAAHPLSDQAFAALLAHPAVQRMGEWLVFEEGAAATERKAQEQDQFLHFLQQSEAAIDLLGAALATTADPALSLLCEHFHQLFHRVADLLLNQDPTRLLALTERVQQFALATATAADSRLFHAIALRNLEAYDAAEAILTDLLAMVDLSPATRGRALNARAIGSFLQGHLQRALDDYGASLHLWQQLGDAVQEGMVSLNMGVVAYECHEYALAERQLLHAESLLAAHQNYTWLAAAHHELALVYRDQGRWPEALRYFERCAARRRLEGATDRLAIALDSMGEIYLLQGRFDQALPLLLEAEAKMTSRVNRIDLLLHLGLLYQLQAQFVQAATYYTMAETLLQAMEESYLLPIVYYRLGDLQLRMNQVEQALAYWRRAIDWIDAKRTPLQEEGLKIHLLGRWQQLYGAVILLLVAQQRIDEALHYVEQARARAFLDLLQGSQRTDTELAAPSVATLPITIADLQAALPPNVAIIEFFACGLPGTAAALVANWPPTALAIRDQLLPPERLLAFVVTATKVSAIELAITSQQIAAQHFAWGDGRLRGVVPIPGQPLRPLRRWDELGRQLLLPLAPYLRGKDHLYLIPHSTLHYLPLHALVEPIQLTGEATTTVSYAPSAAILWQQLQSRPHLSKEPTLLAIGVDGDGLTHAEAEATWVAAQFHGEALLGSAATTTTVLQRLANYQLIHFSCHGHFRRRDPMASALQVADGELTAAQLLATVRLQADLVTLSACDTGLNQLHPGDELMGLTRALLGCGAHSLLVTLWPVHEIPTRLFMTHFYLHWQQGHTKASALHYAQRYVATMTVTLLAEQLAYFGLSPAERNATIDQFQQITPGPHPFAHPYYWAPFLLIGDAR